MVCCKRCADGAVLCDTCKSMLWSEPIKKKARDGIKNLTDALGIGYRREEAVVMASRFFSFAHDQNFTKDHKADLVQASCLYLSCRQLEIAMPLIQISNKLEINITELARVYLKLCKKLYLVKDGNYEEHVDSSVVIPPDVSDDESDDESDNESDDDSEEQEEAFRRAVSILEMPTIQKNTRDVLRKLTDALGIGDGREKAVNMAAVFFSIATDQNFTKDHKADLVHASCLYLSCRKLEIALPLIQISNKLEINITELARVYLKLCEKLYLVKDGNYEEHVDPSFVIPPDFIITPDVSDDDSEEQEEAVRRADKSILEIPKSFISRETREKNARDDLRKLTDALGIGDGGEKVVDMAARVFRAVTEQNFTKDHKADLVQASCIYWSCRKLEIALPLIQISNKLEINITELARVYLKLCESLYLVKDGNYEEHVDPSFVIPLDFITPDVSVYDSEEQAEEAENSPPPATAMEAVRRTLKRKGLSEEINLDLLEDLLDTPEMGGMEEFEDNDDKEETVKSGENAGKEEAPVRRTLKRKGDSGKTNLDVMGELFDTLVMGAKSGENAGKEEAPVTKKAKAEEETSVKEDNVF